MYYILSWVRIISRPWPRVLCHAFQTRKKSVKLPEHRIFSPGDLDLCPMTLTIKLDLDNLRYVPGAAGWGWPTSNLLSVRQTVQSWEWWQTDTNTHRRDRFYYLDRWRRTYEPTIIAFSHAVKKKLEKKIIEKVIKTSLLEVLYLLKCQFSMHRLTANSYTALKTLVFLGGRRNSVFFWSFCICWHRNGRHLANISRKEMFIRTRTCLP